MEYPTRTRSETTYTVYKFLKHHQVVLIQTAVVSKLINKKLTLLILILFFVLGCTEMNRTENLLAKVESLKIKNDSLTKILTEKKYESNYWFDAAYEGEELIKNGITNPKGFIEKSLRKKNEMIPLKAVLGGTMNFGNIQILSKKWLIADFDDGHVQGRAIYEYKLNENGKLEFKLLNSIEPK